MGAGSGNRQDNRQRGNAAQLLEKYKGLARDAQMQGDRVQSEYYLQFADHYFRILNESRARFEETRRQRGDNADEGDEDEDQDEMEAAREDRGRSHRDDDRSRGHREDGDAEDSSNREPRRASNGEDRPRRSRARREEADREGKDDDGSHERIAADILPPAISAAPSGEEGERAPRRRTRRTRDSGDEIAPAA